MNRGIGLPRRIGKVAAASVLLFSTGMTLWAQNAPVPAAGTPDAAMADAITQLQQQVRELREAVAEVRSEAAQYRAETEQLRLELNATRNQLALSAPPPAPPSSAAVGEMPVPAVNPDTGVLTSTSKPPSSIEARVAALEESSQLLSGKVDDQYQTKVDSASKYKVRLTGLVLMNLFSNRGSSDNQDIPTWAVPSSSPSSPNGDFGATLRQSEFGLEVFGPRLAGAKTSGSLQVDFAGGFPSQLDGVNFGLVRLRTATMRMDWDNTSIVAGQDGIFFSPLSPTSFASLAVPAFSYAGNLWAWTPQVRIEHRFALNDQQSVTVQGGILDNLTGESPAFQSNRLPDAGERSGHPAYASRISWTREVFGQPFTLGAGGYYSRQDWGQDRYSDGWAGTADWLLPLSSRFTLSGEFYRGRGVGGLGGALGRSVVFSGDPGNPYTQMRPLNSIGGWSQLKFRATPKLEFNGAFGLDNPYTADLRAFPAGESYIDIHLAQNRSALINFIYRPRSNLLFSSEFRHLKTYEIQGFNQTAEQINLMMGILF